MERISSYYYYDYPNVDEIVEQIEHEHLCSYHRKKHRRHHDKNHKHQVKNNNNYGKYVY